MRFLFWILLVGLVIFRVSAYYLAKPAYPEGTKIKITEKVSAEPIQYSDSQYVKLEGFKIYLPKFPKIRYGDTVVIEGLVDRDKLKSSQIVEIIESENLLYKFREKLIDFYKTNLPTPDSALVSGVVLGARSGVGEDFWQSLVTTGTAHVVVASGMNVTLVTKFLLGALTLIFKRKLAIPLAIVGISFYTVLSGFDAPIIRASIMGILAFVAQEFGRVNYAGRTLVVTALAMLIVWPNWLLDVGFILSFAATGSIIFFEKRVKDRLMKVPALIREDLSTTLSAQVGVAPILFVTFGQFNVFSPLINVAVLWTVPLITVIGMISGLIGVVFEPLGRLILLLVYPMTKWFVFVVTLFKLTGYE